MTRKSATACEYLAMQGFEVIEATNGLEALLQFKRPRRASRARRGQARPPHGRPAPHARARALRQTVEGRASGQARALLRPDLRRLPPEPRHRARRRGVGLRDRSRRTACERRHASLLGASEGNISPTGIALIA